MMINLAMYIKILNNCLTFRKKNKVIDIKKQIMTFKVKKI